MTNSPKWGFREFAHALGERGYLEINAGRLSVTELAKALIGSGWLVPNAETMESLSRDGTNHDVLSLLSEAAEIGMARAKHVQEQRQATALTQLLDWMRRGSAKLTLGWPYAEDRPLDQWLGQRLMWWPHGVPEGRKVAWVSSRLGRAIDERPDWFAVLRSATAKLDPARDVLLTARSTTVDRFLDRAAILFGLRRLRVHLDEQRTLVDWLTRLRRQLWRRCLAHDSELLFAGCDAVDFGSVNAEVFVSPMIETAHTNPKRKRGRAIQDALSSEFSGASGLACASGLCAEHALDGLPLSDRVLIAAADQVLALQIRPEGNLHQLLRARLTDTRWPAASVWLALGEALVPAEVATELQSHGAVGWWLFVADASGVRQQNSASTNSDARRVGHDILNEFPWPDGEYLVHWTRRRDGPWPGQSETDFIDDLLLWPESTNHSAFAALSRIVQQRRLIASAAGIRGDAAVVSFSAHPLSELMKRRTFRAHRGRWDCEAYGLCLRRDWLQTRGAMPVIYGDDSQWPTLSDSDRPFFQLKTTRSRRGTKTIDWSQEAEWRVPQDVDLSEAHRDDVMLFVPTEAEARQLVAISPWPVLVTKPQ